MKFLLFLIEKSRLNILKDIAKAFENIYLNYKNIVPVTIKSAGPIEPKQMQALLKRLQEKLGKEIQPHTVIDKKLLGGFKIETGHVVYDGSLRTQLDNFKEHVITTI